MGKKSVKKLTLREKKELKMKDVDLVTIKKNINRELLNSSYKPVNIQSQFNQNKVTP